MTIAQQLEALRREIESLMLETVESISYILRSQSNEQAQESIARFLLFYTRQQEAADAGSLAQDRYGFVILLYREALRLLRLGEEERKIVVE